MSPTSSLPPFEGIPPSGLAFLTELGKHDNTRWFRAHHTTYRTELREPMLALAAALNVRLARFAPEYVTPPGRAITSINRDLRFAAEDTPTYKGWMALAFRREGATPGSAASLYVSVAPEAVRVRCGLPMPATETSRRLREFLVEGYPALRRVLARAGIRNAFGTVVGDRYKRLPPDMPTDHPAPDLLCFKSLYVETLLPVAASAEPSFVGEVARRFRMALPLVRLIDGALLGPAELPDERPSR